MRKIFGTDGIRGLANAEPMTPETMLRLALAAGQAINAIDLGSGTGRFTPALADTFGGPVYGVEPSARMRETAQAQSAAPWPDWL